MHACNLALSACGIPGCQPTDGTLPAIFRSVIDRYTAEYNTAAVRDHYLLS